VLTASPDAAAASAPFVSAMFKACNPAAVKSTALLMLLPFVLTANEAEEDEDDVDGLMYCLMPLVELGLLPEPMCGGARTSITSGLSDSSSCVKVNIFCGLGVPCGWVAVGLRNSFKNTCPQDYRTNINKNKALSK
jgi:hypothetical protein